MNTVFSPCRTYRYTLWRGWGGMFEEPNFVMFIGLNPSTADETNDDPTIRRCIGYAKAWGFDGYLMTNLFAYRSTDPRVMKAHPEPIGPDNDKWLVDCAAKAGIVVAAWGTHGAHLGRGEYVRRLIPGLHYLRLTKDGFPAHPLYLPADLKPVKWE